MPGSALWMTSGGQTTVGTAAIASAANELTITGHGLTDGLVVYASTATGGAVDVLIPAAPYYVRNPTVDTFQLAPSPGGPIMDFTSDGGADIARGEALLAADEMRRALGGLLYAPRPSADGVGARFARRSGVLPNSTGDSVTISGFTVTVHDLQAVVSTNKTTQVGSYLVELASEQLTVTAADATDPRIDIVILEVLDDAEDSSAQRNPLVRIIDGIPASIPMAPAVPDGALRLATITVPAVLGGDPTLVYDAQETAASGGVVPVATVADLPVAFRREGAYADVADADALMRFNGAVWEVVARPGVPVSGWTPVTAGVRGAGTGDFSVDVTDGGRFPVGTFSRLRLTMKGDLDAAGTIRIRVNDDSTAGLHRTGMVVMDAGGTVGPTHHAEGTTWYLAEWATVSTNTATVEIFDTDGSNLLSYMGSGTRQSSSTTVHSISQAWGSLTASRLMSTIHVRPFSSGANVFGDIMRWELEGYRP